MASRNPQRPNVVFVLTDDQGPWALACAGTPEIQTPNLDRLAADGLRAERFFCVSPVCSPARASLLTGEIPSFHGVHDWLDGGHYGTRRIDFLAGRTLVTDLLADAGYRCGLVGKWHLGAHDVPRSGFVHWFAHRTGGGPYFGAPMFVRDTSGDVTAKDVDGYLTYALTDDALAFIRDEDTRPEPFFLALNYTAPHSPWKDNHPEELTALYVDCDFPSIPQLPPHPWQPHVDGRPVGGEHDVRQALIGYFAAVTGVDRGVGAVMDELDRRGLRESTLVIFSSDNGFNCGHHGIWGKGNGTYPQNMYDTSVTVPAIFHHPGRIPGGRVSDALLSGYDLLPTVVAYLGLRYDPCHDVPGRSFAGLLAGDPDWCPADRVVVFDEYGPVRMVRTPDWKYVHRAPHGPHELYDLHADPGEEHNLAALPKYATEASRLRQHLTDWFTRYTDPAHDGTKFPVSGNGQVDLDNAKGAFS